MAMTREAAQLEARRRWGLHPEAQVFDRIDDTNSEALHESAERIGRYWVGTRFRIGKSGHVYGNGNSWEEAFAGADTRELEPVPRSISDADVEKLKAIFDRCPRPHMKILLGEILDRLKAQRPL